MNTGINSSKVYCKFNIRLFKSQINYVLIVAKCIVNVKSIFPEEVFKLRINSSKVYCKS